MSQLKGSCCQSAQNSLEMGMVGDCICTPFITWQVLQSERILVSPLGLLLEGQLQMPTASKVPRIVDDTLRWNVFVGQITAGWPLSVVEAPQSARLTTCLNHFLSEFFAPVGGSASNADCLQGPKNC